MDETRQENLDISIHRAKCSITLKDVMVQRTAMPHPSRRPSRPWTWNGGRESRSKGKQTSN